MEGLQGDKEATGAQSGAGEGSSGYMASGQEAQSPLQPRPRLREKLSWPDLKPQGGTSLQNAHLAHHPQIPSLVVVVKNQPSHAEDAGSIPGRGTKIPRAVGQLSPDATT